MALDNPIGLHFDRTDGQTVTDADNTVHLPKLIQGSTAEFQWYFRDKNNGLSIIPSTGYSVICVLISDGIEQARTVATASGNLWTARFTADDLAAVTKDVGDVFIEYTVSDGPPDAHQHTCAIGRYYMRFEGVK